jgi:hypothetical protein
VHSLPPPSSTHYSSFCTSKASKLECLAASAPPLDQYLYFCTSKASKLSEYLAASGRPLHHPHAPGAALPVLQYEDTCIYSIKALSS